MFTGKEILIAVVSAIISVISMLAVIKWLSNALLNYLRETLLELKQNDQIIFDQINKNKNCITGMKKDIAKNEKDIFSLQSDIKECKEKHDRQ